MEFLNSSTFIGLNMAVEKLARFSELKIHKYQDEPRHHIDQLEEGQSCAPEPLERKTNSMT